MRNVLTFVEEAGIKLKEAIMNVAICMASIRFLVIVVLISIVLRLVTVSRSPVASVVVGRR